MRKTLMTLALLLAAAPVGTQDAADPLAVVQALFAAMKAGDADAMAELLHPDARLVSTSVRDGVPTAQAVDVARWLSGVRASTRELDERIHDPKVRVQDGLATVWTAYDLFVDGAHSHCGVDAFTLVRTADGWRIMDIADTRRTEGCAGS